MHVAIGSFNLVKHDAVVSVIEPLYPAATFVGVSVPSGVRDQPWGDAETRLGAINRARAAREAQDADFGIGLEGGVVETEVGLILCNWVAIVGRDGRLGVGGGGGELLPEQVAGLVRAGSELGSAMDALTGRANVKQAEGSVGILTAGLVDRRMVYELALRLALAPFRTPHWYKPSP